MVLSQEVQRNPNLYVFLPLLYVVWSDNVLTQRELQVLKNRIDCQSWLSDKEKEFLYRLIDPQLPPTPSELKQWLEAIRKVPLKQAHTLAEIGSLTVKFYSGREANAQVTGALAGIESELGLIGREATYAFRPEYRLSLTQQQHTHDMFDVSRMTALLDAEEAPLIQRVKQVIASPEFAYIETDNLNEYRQQVLRWTQILASYGFGSIGYPKEYGGQGDMAAYFTVMETLSYHDLSLVVKFGVQFGLWGMSVYFLGTEKHHKKYLKDIGTLALPGCFAMTETGHGSNVRGIETTATYNHNNQTFTIHTPHPQAQKEYIGNAALHGRMATVFAKLIINGVDYGVNAFIVSLRDEEGNTLPGITISDCGRKLGLNGVDNGIIRFNQVVIPMENMLDRFARINENGEFESPITSDNRRFFTMLGTLVGGRIGIPRSGNAACKSALTIAIRYGDRRVQFGPEGAPEVPILNYRTHQRRLMPLLANTYALHFALKYLTRRFLDRTEDEMQEIEALAAALKAWGTWNTTATLQECREACGGKGYLFENRIGTLKNDTDIYTTFEGDNTVLMQLVAKSRLTDFKQEFSSMNAFGLLNYLAGQAATAIMELNPLIVRNTDEAHLLDPEFHLNAFRYRERDILTSAARRLKRHIDEGMDSFDAFNVCQHHLVQVAFAYTERVILEQFIVAVEGTQDDGCKTALMQLYRIFALNLLDKHKGWYLEQGYMEGVKTKAIRKLLNQMCWDVRTMAVPLVNAFAIPDACLAAPIALNHPPAFA
ncbi:MAG: acyl-CoA oxidase [Cyclobacteriaceae bacterium]|nr:MAG: acyl-CoA oxidase [Cyclobacteriaceae bacterium]